LKITHHLDDATILAYSAGSLAEAHAALAAGHIAYCPRCRTAVQQANDIGGYLLVESENAAVSDQCRAATLASLDGVAPQQVVRDNRHSRLDGHGIPAAISALSGKPRLEELNWKKKAPGISIAEVALSENSKSTLKFLSIAPGLAMPEHGHGGHEMTLILRGSYSDHVGQFLPGDIADLDEETEHRPVVDSDEPCICIIATEAPTKFRSILARMAQPFVGI
jgi:putative transcriptional regulator